MKSNPCKECGSIYHTAMYHKRRPLRKEAVKTRQKRLETTEEWFKLNPGPTWECYISKHPLCPKILTRETINLEHDQSKARRPDLKYDVTQLYPACTWDNQAKGSMSAEEYMAKPVDKY